MNIADIAKAAFDGAASAVADSVHTATLSWDVQSSYNTTTGSYAGASPTDTGRLTVASERPAGDLFPDYVAGPNDEMLLLEGFSTAPKEGYEVTANGRTWDIQRVQDISAAGSLFYVMGRKK